MCAHVSVLDLSVKSHRCHPESIAQSTGFRSFRCRIYRAWHLGQKIQWLTNAFRFDCQKMAIWRIKTDGKKNKSTMNWIWRNAKMLFNVNLLCVIFSVFACLPLPRWRLSRVTVIAGVVQTLVVCSLDGDALILSNPMWNIAFGWLRFKSDLYCFV